MTVRIFGEHSHPKDCPVCDRQVVSVALVGSHGTGPGSDQWLVSRIAHVIACPQCTGASGLLQVLSPSGGAS